eukprot:5871067-Lingulodinium_polyedra.AAC.1
MSIDEDDVESSSLGDDDELDDRWHGYDPSDIWEDMVDRTTQIRPASANAGGGGEIGLASAKVGEMSPNESRSDVVAASPNGGGPIVLGPGGEQSPAMTCIPDSPGGRRPAPRSNCSSHVPLQCMRGPASGQGRAGACARSTEG